ncbi:hypothetical protein [Candidatus Bartonella washoeensis]|nr:hypothetical protein [Bartonella washoeensis]
MACPPLALHFFSQERLVRHAKPLSDSFTGVYALRRFVFLP